MTNNDEKPELTHGEHVACHHLWREKRESLVDTGHDFTQLALAHDMFFAGYEAALGRPPVAPLGSQMTAREIKVSYSMFKEWSDTLDFSEEAKDFAWATLTHFDKRPVVPLGEDENE